MNLTGNPLKSINDRSLYGLTSLVVLDLSDCDLHTIPEYAFTYLKSLLVLNLHQNAITYYRSELPRSDNHLKLNLLENPLDFIDLTQFQDANVTVKSSVVYLCCALTQEWLPAGVCNGTFSVLCPLVVDYTIKVVSMTMGVLILLVDILFVLVPVKGKTPRTYSAIKVSHNLMIHLLLMIVNGIIIYSPVGILLLCIQGCIVELFWCCVS